MVTYSESGVDIDLEAITVSKLASKLKSTLEYRDIITDSGHYAALVRLGDKAIAMSTDGVGSKILIAEMMNKYDTVGIDCIAMVVNDILCVGAEPIALVILITSSLTGSVKPPLPIYCLICEPALVPKRSLSPLNSTCPWFNKDPKAVNKLNFDSPTPVAKALDPVENILTKFSLLGL